MSDLRRRLAAIEAQLAALERRSPEALCPACRLPLSGEDREGALLEREGQAMALHWAGDVLHPLFCLACKLRERLEPMRLRFDDSNGAADLLPVAETTGPWEGDE